MAAAGFVVLSPRGNRSARGVGGDRGHRARHCVFRRARAGVFVHCARIGAAGSLSFV